MRIAFFCDGTWNDPASNTNVGRLFTATEQLPGEQVAKYDSGVGTDGKPVDHLFGGAFGAGLVNKVKDGYSQIANAYSADDELFLFGFSRGAYTARCLAGMIAICGLPTQNVNQECIDTAWQAYRTVGDEPHRQSLLASMSEYGMHDAKITMLGVWDTVGSLGIPALWGEVDTNQYGFLSTDLHADVLNAFQAVAIDEQRKQFPPSLWTAACGEGQVMEQVWFTGVHCDVGGGYAPGTNDNGTLLADITLAWMAGKAQALGLKLDAAFTAKYQTPAARYALNELHDSKTGLFKLDLPFHRTIPKGAAIGSSVAIRLQHGSGYAPGNLTLANGVPAGDYVLVDTVGPPPIVDWGSTS
jgi:uncharacterized protein (DUF2235 family)